MNGPAPLCECVQDGVSNKFNFTSGMWCCKTTEDQCITVSFTHIICNGATLSLSERCHNENYDGPACNYYPWNEGRNGALGEVSRSYLDLCQDKYVGNCK